MTVCGHRHKAIARRRLSRCARDAKNIAADMIGQSHVCFVGENLDSPNLEKPTPGKVAVTTPTAD